MIIKLEALDASQVVGLATFLASEKNKIEVPAGHIFVNESDSKVFAIVKSLVQSKDEGVVFTQLTLECLEVVELQGNNPPFHATPRAHIIALLDALELFPKD